MAQLSDDCFAFGGALLTVEAALARIEERVSAIVETERAAAGHPLGRPARGGEAIRIFTGAPMPDGTDTVMMQEDCIIEDGRVRLQPGIRKGANRRHAGEDVAQGSIALPAGRRLKPADLGLAAALGNDA